MYQRKIQVYDTASSPDFGPIGNTVVRMSQGLEGKNHKLILDNLFTIIPVLTYLKKKQIYVLGTIRSNSLQGEDSKL